MNSMTIRNDGANDTLSLYLTEIRRFPMLGAEEESELVRRWHEDRDAVALNQLIGSHLRLVVKLARGYSGYGLPLADLISQGHIGLMRAADKFDTERGVRFNTYATWWVRAAIQEYILHSWSLVKMGTTAAQKKLFFNLRRLKSRLQAFEHSDLEPDVAATIARELAVPLHEVQEMNRRLGARDQSLNATIGPESEDEWQDQLVDETADPEGSIAARDELDWRRGLLKDGLCGLNARERHILEQRRLKEEPLTLEDLGREYGISRERVRQIESRAIEKLRNAMRSAARDADQRSRQLCYAE